MLVRLETCFPWEGQTRYHGEEINLPDDMARKLIATRQAEAISPPIEVAALQTTPPKGRRNERIQATRS